MNEVGAAASLVASAFLSVSALSSLSAASALSSPADAPAASSAALSALPFADSSAARSVFKSGRATAAIVVVSAACVEPFVAVVWFGVLVAVVSLAGGVWPEGLVCDDKDCEEGDSVDKVPAAALADGMGLGTGGDRSGFRAGRGIVSVLASAQAGTAQAKAIRSAILYACVRFMIVGCFRLRLAFSA